MVINFVDLNKNNLEIISSLDLKNITKTESFNHILENKIDRHDKDSYKKYIKEKENKTQNLESKNHFIEKPSRKLDKTEDNDIETNENKLVSMDKEHIHEILKYVTYLLKQLSRIDPDLYKVLLKRFSSIKESLLKCSKWGDQKNIKFIKKLLLFLKELKEAVKNIPSGNSESNVVKIKDNSEEATDNKNARSSKSVVDNSLDQKELIDQENRIIEIENLKTKKSKPSVSLKSGNDKKNINKTIPIIKKNLNNRFFTNIEIKSTQNLKLSVEETNEPPPISRVEIQKLIERIASRIKITLADNQNEVTMNLKPEFLGRVTIKLILKDNVLSGKFIVDSIYAEKAFKDSLAQLKVNLQNMGMEVQNFDVALNDRRNLDDYSNIHNFNKNNRTYQVESENESALLSSAVETYESLGWIAQNINIAV